MRKIISAFTVALTILLMVSCTSPYSDKGRYEITGTQQREGDDPYMEALYWKINESPMQQKLRNVKPFPVGVVYYQQRGDNFDSAKKEFDIIKKLGFTALKQVQLKAPYNPDNFREKVFHAALDAGISPWYYGKGGWAPITQELVDELGIDMEVNKENMPKIQEHPKMIEYQTELMRKRIARMDDKPEKPRGMGEPGRNNPWMPERLLPHFAEWLKEQYGTVDSLKRAWNNGYIEPLTFTTFEAAARELKGRDFDQFGNGVGKLSKDFRRYRDAMKFQSELIVNNYKKVMEMYTEWDPLEPERTGGHQIFENQACNTWDLEGQARAASIGGSFYSSIHMAHHFFLVDGELTLPVYLQARTVADMFKGGWAATWESTGGPTNHSGYFPYTVDAKEMRHYMLSYIAAGLKGIGFWMWNSRGEGWELGEYALCDVQGKPAKRAKIAGRISSVLQEQRFELWEAMDEPTVGILYSWENEAMLGRLSLGQYPLDTYVYESDWDKQFRQYHSEAKIGISRALANNQIPFEYVTERNIDEGLAQRYPIIYLPYVMALEDDIVEKLMDYVEKGGHIVADMPVLMMDDYGRLRKHHKGSGFEKLFGFQTADYYHTFNYPLRFKGVKLDSYFGDIKLTHGKALESYSDGTPAVIKSQYGEGTATVFNFEAGRSVFKPGNKKMEKIITWYTLGDVRPQYEVEGAEETFVYRRAAPDADHYFFINDGKKENVTVSSGVIEYSSAKELISGKEVEVVSNSMEIKVPAHSGVWVRAVKE